jgi:hypothetical protein
MKRLHAKARDRQDDGAIMTADNSEAGMTGRTVTRFVLMVRSRRSQVWRDDGTFYTEVEAQECAPRPDNIGLDAFRIIRIDDLPVKSDD